MVYKIVCGHCGRMTAVPKETATMIKDEPTFYLFETLRIRGVLHAKCVDCGELTGIKGEDQMDDQQLFEVVKELRCASCVQKRAATDNVYYERNMLALFYADGWYIDHAAEPGWQRALSLAAGKITYHVPDSFDVGNLPQIEPNWDGTDTEAKYAFIAGMRGIREGRMFGRK
jgi:hypothetical protein